MRQSFPLTKAFIASIWKGFKWVTPNCVAYPLHRVSFTSLVFFSFILLNYFTGDSAFSSITFEVVTFIVLLDIVAASLFTSWLLLGSICSDNNNNSSIFPSFQSPHSNSVWISLFYFMLIKVCLGLQGYHREVYVSFTNRTLRSIWNLLLFHRSQCLLQYHYHFHPNL